MVLPTSGPISFNAINIELGLSGTTNKSMNDANYRTLAAVASGTIDLQDFYGKSSILDTFNITVKQGSIAPTKGSPYNIHGFMDSNYEFVAASGGISGDSISDATFAVTSSRIDAIYWSPSIFEFAVDGLHPNSGWTNMAIYHVFTGTTVNVTRASCGHSQIGSQTMWTVSMGTNPFSNITAGQNQHDITFS